MQINLSTLSSGGSKPWPVVFQGEFNKELRMLKLNQNFIHKQQENKQWSTKVLIQFLVFFCVTWHCPMIPLQT